MLLLPKTNVSQMTITMHCSNSFVRHFAVAYLSRNLSADLLDNLFWWRLVLLLLRNAHFWRFSAAKIAPTSAATYPHLGNLIPDHLFINLLNYKRAPHFMISRFLNWRYKQVFLKWRIQLSNHIHVTSLRGHYDCCLTTNSYIFSSPPILSSLYLVDVVAFFWTTAHTLPLQI